MKYIKAAHDTGKVRLAITGHRFWPDLEWERSQFIITLTNFLFVLSENEIPKEKLVFLTGVATGVDLWFAEVAMFYGIELHVYTPFKRTTQIARAKMNAEQIQLFNSVWKYASTIAIISDVFFYYAYQIRNEALVDHSHILLTYYTRKRSGSGNCVRYANTRGRRVIDLKPYEENCVTRGIHNWNKLLE